MPVHSPGFRICLVSAFNWLSSSQACFSRFDSSRRIEPASCFCLPTSSRISSTDAFSRISASPADGTGLKFLYIPDGLVGCDILIDPRLQPFRRPLPFVCAFERCSSSSLRLRSLSFSSSYPVDAICRSSSSLLNFNCAA